MDALLPAATAFDAVSAIASALIYLAVGFGALARAPRDARVRVFLVTALASAAPYGINALIWARGSAAALTRPVVIVTALSLMVGALALLHFTQVFPWRRPWIRRHGRWLYAGYAAAIALVAVSALATQSLSVDGSLDAGSGGLGAVSAGVTELVLIAVVLPALVLLGIVVPFAGLLSLFKSWQEAKARGLPAARQTTLWMLVSQLGGGVLTILVIPLLRLVAPAGPWVTIAAALLFGFSLLMPLAFAAGVWKLGVLELPVNGEG
jgi:hypothetical protein